MKQMLNSQSDRRCCVVTVICKSGVERPLAILKLCHKIILGGGGWIRLTLTAWTLLEMCIQVGYMYFLKCAVCDSVRLNGLHNSLLQIQFYYCKANHVLEIEFQEIRQNFPLSFIKYYIHHMEKYSKFEICIRISHGDGYEDYCHPGLGAV
jgi:hypothetical protein